MKFAAIDIGSNGARMLISRVIWDQPPKDEEDLPQCSFKDIEYTRFPLRLGKDVFFKRKISSKKAGQLRKLMQVFQMLIDLHEVDDVLAYATSAFREAHNGEKLIDVIYEETGLRLQIITGQDEAEVLSRVIQKYLEPEQCYLHTDVGGGSTEVNLYRGQDKITGHSFPIGSLRQIRGNSYMSSLQELMDWIRIHIQKEMPYRPIVAIGTGGNINKAYNLINPGDRRLHRDDLKVLRHYLAEFSEQERMDIFKLNPDRAETIIPATDLYVSSMEAAGAHEMIIPKVGLKDGMLELLLERNIHNL